ncbi:MAG: hypothetical protein ACXVCY_04285 [Pseudobdellovibrionaceae bacterium]
MSLFDIFKAKKLPVGTITKRADGRYVKKPAGWKKIPTQSPTWKKTILPAMKNLKTDFERDEHIANLFKKRGVRFHHIIHPARMVLSGRPMDAVPDHGFAGLCKLIINRAYEMGPKGFEGEFLKNINKAFKTAFSEEKKTIVPLHEALKKKTSTAHFRKYPKWFEYCCKRYALKNGGMVDLSHIPKYMENAMAYHSSKTPPPVDYDRTRKPKYIFKRKAKK